MHCFSTIQKRSKRNGRSVGAICLNGYIFKMCIWYDVIVAQIYPRHPLFATAECSSLTMEQLELTSLFLTNRIRAELELALTLLSTVVHIDLFKLVKKNRSRHCL